MSIADFEFQLAISYLNQNDSEVSMVFQHHDNQIFFENHSDFGQNHLSSCFFAGRVRYTGVKHEIQFYLAVVVTPNVRGVAHAAKHIYGSVQLNSQPITDNFNRNTHNEKNNQPR